MPFFAAAPKENQQKGRKWMKGGGSTNTMISESGGVHQNSDHPPSPSSSSLLSAACQLSSSRDTRSTSSSFQPLFSACIMTSGEFLPSAPLLVHKSRRSLLYKSLCFLLLFFQGGVLDFYLILFTDLYWCSWIATDLVVISGWGVFFLKNARSQRERACGFHQKSSIFGCNLGEFTYAYLAWLIYVIACTPKVVLILETSILELIALKVPCGVTGFKITVLLSTPLLFCLINSIVVDLNGPTRHHSQSCFTSTCLDLLDSFTLMEMLLRGELPSVYLKYTVITVYFVALAVPVVWLYELTAAVPVAVGPFLHRTAGQRSAARRALLPGVCLQDAGVGVHVQEHLLAGVPPAGAAGAVRRGAGPAEADWHQQPSPVLPLRVRERHVSPRICQHSGRHAVLISLHVLEAGVGMKQTQRRAKPSLSGQTAAVDRGWVGGGEGNTTGLLVSLSDKNIQVAGFPLAEDKDKPAQ